MIGSNCKLLHSFVMTRIRAYLKCLLEEKEAISWVPSCNFNLRKVCVYNRLIYCLWSPNTGLTVNLPSSRALLQEIPNLFGNIKFQSPCASIPLDEVIKEFWVLKRRMRDSKYEILLLGGYFECIYCSRSPE